MGKTIYVLCLLVLGIWQISVAVAAKRPLNEQEKLMLEDLNQDGPSGRSIASFFGRNNGVKKPRCYFEDFTASCCVQMKYRTITEKKKVKPRFHRACIEAGIVPTQLKIFVRAYYDTIRLDNATTVNETKEIFNHTSHFGRFCWNLPEPIDSLELCIWLYHLNISFNALSPKAEMCLSFDVTRMLRMQLDCLNWEDGLFDLHRERHPPDRSAFTLHAGQGGFQFKIKATKGMKKAWKKVLELWKTTKKLFAKSKDHEQFLLEPAEN